MHRADLVDMLAKNLPAGVVHTGHRCTGYERRGETARVTFDNGEAAEGDVVVGADGIHSVLRRHVHPESRPVFSGTITYRGVVPVERVPEWPEESWLMWLGKGKHFLVYPLRAGKLINFVGFVPADREMKESWSAAGDPEALRHEFADWDPRIGYLLGQVQTTFRTALFDRDPLPSWTKGRLTLLGDAAHAMLPHLGQGANQSIEDGMALATILANADRSTVLAGLLLYERLRRERTAMVQTGARKNGLRYDSFHSDLNLRDSEISAHGGFRRQLYDYDVVPEARALALDLV
jgi:salicylate hydroxylase